MGEAAEDILNGIVCQCCGVWMDDFEEVGYPRTCESCEEKTK